MDPSAGVDVADPAPRHVSRHHSRAPARRPAAGPGARAPRLDECALVSSAHAPLCGRPIRGLWLASALCCAMLSPAGTLQAATFSEFVDPNPAPGNQFGATVVALSTGNVVVTSPFDDAGGTDAGAVYLFNGSTGALISTLRGSTASDQIGTSVTALSNGNYVVSSSSWDNGAVVNAGAAPWGSGTTGVSGVVSAANSLVGSTANDNVGSTGVTALSNGNYVVASAVWDNGAVLNAGAVTWGSGTTGVTGVVSAVVPLPQVTA